MDAFTYIPLGQMIATVEGYIFLKKSIQVAIVPPRNDKELQLLGIAYDIAVGQMWGFN